LQIADGTEDARRKAHQRPDLRIAAPGSGSDYTAFIDPLGIASLNLGNGGETKRRHPPFQMR
jgi:N-acetylated-alpha-linked acidic dipeptidase